jgi:hypothetical protein
MTVTRPRFTLALAAVGLIGTLSGTLVAVDRNGDVVTRYESTEQHRITQSGEVMMIPKTRPPIAEWMPDLPGVNMVALEDERQIPEQENMFSQLVATDVDVITLEQALRAWMTSEGFRVSDTAVNEWGPDGEWVRGLHLAGMKEGVEVSLTLSAQPPNRGSWAPGYRSGLLIWRSARANIVAEEVDRYRGYGGGFLPLEAAL